MKLQVVLESNPCSSCVCNASTSVIGHIGTDTLSWALLAATVTGIDILSDSLRYATTLAGRMGVEAEFIEPDVMDVMDKRTVFLHEYPRYFYGGYTPHDVEGDTVQLYPCTFSLKAMAT